MAEEAVVLEPAVDHSGAVVEPDLAKAAGGGVVVPQIAPGDPELEGQVVAAAGQAGARFPAVAGAAVAPADVAGQATAKDRAAGDQIQNAADRVGAVEHRGRAADHLDDLDAVDVDQTGDLTEVGLPASVVHAQAVLEEQHAQAALAADHRA